MTLLVCLSPRFSADIRAMPCLLFTYLFSSATSFRHRIDDIEREKHDLLVVVSRLKEDSAQRDGAFFFLTVMGIC